MQVIDLATLTAAVRGRVLTPEHADYDDTRRIWNGMIDRRPAVIVQPAGAADVRTAVSFARETGLSIAIRGGGHSFPGFSVCDAGLMIDMQSMKGIRVDPVARRAQAQAGLTWHEFDLETQAFGLATTGGMISHTGIAGLTLGGGFGQLARSYGLAIDNLRSADVVTADGALVTASATEHPDLFWALRGGGGNFGVVTAFEYQLHEVGPLFAGIIAYPLPQARQVLRGMHEVMSKAPDQLMATGVLMTTPDGHKAVAVVPVWNGDLAQGEKAIAAFKTFGTVVMEQVGPMPYTVVQTLFNESAVTGRRFYIRSNFLNDITEPLIDTLADAYSRTPSPLNGIVMPAMAGAISRVPPDATAYFHRAAAYTMNIFGCWTAPSDDDANISWMKNSWGSLAPHLPRAVYVNELEDEGHDRVRAAYGPAYDRLAAIKRRYDPENIFRLNQNIQPA